MTKIYTKTGDDGTTGIIGGKRVKKSDPRILAYGMVDELNSSIGIILSHYIDIDIRDLLTTIQNDLFIVGSDLANPALDNTTNRVTLEMVTSIENTIDKLERKLEPITYFILPGGDLIASHMHHTRSICRRAETNIVELANLESINTQCQIYINRLSDLFFVLARTINKRKNVPDIAWKK